MSKPTLTPHRLVAAAAGLVATALVAAPLAMADGTQPQEQRYVQEISALSAKQLAAAFGTTPIHVSSGGAGRGGKTQTLRFFDRETSTTLTTKGGKVIDKPPYPDAKPGDVLDVYSLAFAGNHTHHAKHWSMSTHLQCVFGAGAPDCVSHTAVGGSLLIFSGNPGTLTAGTGRYAGATGRVLKNKEVKGGSDVVVRIRLAD